MNSNFGIVKLNIGGAMFQTTKTTLTKFDGFFKTILSTALPVTKDETGAFFIDRDPTHFQLILNFMRDGDVELPTCQKEIKKISKEAQYYLLTGLVELCSKHVQYKPDNEIFKILNSEEEKDSVVLNSKKPVLIISSSYSIIDYVGYNYNEWKQFIEKHSSKWNIFFNRARDEEWCIHYDGKKFLYCRTVSSEKYNCGHPFIYVRSNDLFIHLEYHMNRCLTHPENMDLGYKEYSRFLNR